MPVKDMQSAARTHEDVISYLDALIDDPHAGPPDTIW